MRAALALGLMALAAPTLADPLQVQNVRYVCDRGVEVPATFVTGPEDALVVLWIEGNQILLYQDMAASGARYAWPSDGAGYVLWSKGEEATVSWREGQTELPLLTCTTQ